MRELRGSVPEASDVEEALGLLASGVYRLRVLAVDPVAKMDASYIVELVPLKEGHRR
jgi:hypothetical protein